MTTRTHTCLHAHKHTHTHTHTHMYHCMHINSQLHTHTLIYAHMHTHIHKFALAHSHAHTHTHIHTHKNSTIYRKSKIVNAATFGEFICHRMALAEMKLRIVVFLFTESELLMLASGLSSTEPTMLHRLVLQKPRMDNTL